MLLEQIVALLGGQRADEASGDARVLRNPRRPPVGGFLDDVDALQVDYPNLHKFACAAHEFGV
jgi:hypothetical protein